MKTKYLIIVGVFLGVNIMFGVWWLGAGSEVTSIEDSIEQAYEAGDYRSILSTDLAVYESLGSFAQEQIVLALIKSNDLSTAQSLIARTTNPTANTRLYNKLITFTLQEDRDALERILTNERSNIVTIRALLSYYRALVAHQTGDNENAQILLEQSLNLDGLAGASHLLGAKIAPRLEFRPRAIIDTYYDSAEELGAVLGDEERYDRGVMKFYRGQRDLMREYFAMIDNSEYQVISQIIFDGRDKLGLEEYDMAIARFNDAVTYDEENRIPYLRLGRTYAEQEQREIAKNYYEQGLERSRNWEVLTDLVRVYDALGQSQNIRTTSFQIEQILGTNVGIHRGVLGRFIEIYEPNYIQKYADESLKKYNNGRFDREDADERYENSLESLYATIQDAYITLMVNRRQTGRLGNEYRDILLGMTDRTQIADIYLMLVFEREGDPEAVARMRGYLSDADKRNLGLIRIFNRIYLNEYAGATRELTNTVDELTDLDVLRLTWRIADGQGQRLVSAENDLRQLLDATNEETVTLEEGFESHFGSVTGQIRKFYAPE